MGSVLPDYKEIHLRLHLVFLRFHFFSHLGLFHLQLILMYSKRHGVNFIFLQVTIHHPHIVY